MTLEQAQELLDYIALDRSPDAAKLVPLPGERYAVKVTSPCYFCWAFSDWTAFRQAEEQKRLQEVS